MAHSFLYLAQENVNAFNKNPMYFCSLFYGASVVRPNKARGLLIPFWKAYFDVFVFMIQLPTRPFHIIYILR